MTDEAATTAVHPTDSDLAKKMGWALDQLVETPGANIINALLFTTDGMPQARSQGLDRDDADRTAAALAGIKSYQSELGGFCGEADTTLPFRYVTSDMKTHTVFVFSAGERTGVGVSVKGASTDASMSLAITETLKMIQGLRPLLEARERAS